MTGSLVATMPRLRTEELPRSPRSLSSTSGSSRRVSLSSSGYGEKRIDLSSPPPPPTRGGRKRAASLELIENSPSMPELSIGSPRTEPLSSGSNHLCLCQPDPKIPRPRNAFILYRQHYQGQVISQHPGLANPEISKIIGQQWRNQPVEVQNEWKRLAEEEKLRHQRQYPDYRYQPRRAGRNPTRSSTTDDPFRCSKCKGRFISQPGTPLTPYPPTPAPANTTREHSEPQLNQLQRRDTSDRSRVARTLQSLSRKSEDSIMSNFDLNRRGMASPPLSARMTTHPSHQHPSNPQRSPHLLETTASKHYVDVEAGMASPRKRPRPESLPSMQSPYPGSGSPQWADRGPPSAVPRGMRDRGHPASAHPGYERHPAYAKVERGGRMEPPPAPTPHGTHFPHHQPHHPSGPHDRRLEDLRLPPLHTQHRQAGGAEVGSPVVQRTASFSASKSIEAMVMSIPFLNKIKVLSKIAPPLAAPGPTSPVNEVRGPVIAVEGTDERLVAEVGRFIELALGREEGVEVKTWTDAVYTDDAGKEGKRKKVEVIDVDLEDADRPSTPDNSKRDKEAKGAEEKMREAAEKDKGSAILEYLDNIRTWHPRSTEIKKFITTLPSTTDELSESPEAKGLPTPRKELEESTSNKSASPEPARDDGEENHTIPVALLPTGYSLTASDRAASRIPIEDSYAPVDHWQWMATLWRGIVGVDLTIYVNSAARDGDVTAVGYMGGGLGGGEVVMDKGTRAMVIQCSNGRLSDGMLRRAGFEVGEWVRGFEEGSRGRHV